MGDRYSCIWENSKIFSDEEIKAIYDKIVLKMGKEVNYMEKELTIGSILKEALIEKNISQALNWLKQFSFPHTQYQEF